FQASDPERSAWVAANAGSGKTKVLIDRVARLLLEGVAPDAILCVTYTKAAASEMQARLFRRLGGWCVAADKELRADLGDLQGREAKTYQPEDLGKARELFARALETPGGLRIETLHAFCGRLLRRFPLEAGAPPGFRELDDADAARLWERSLAKLGALAGGDDEIGNAIRDVALFAGARGVSEPLRALGGKRAEFQAFIQKAGGLDGAIGALRDDLNAPLDDEAALLERGMGSDLPVANLKPLIPILATGAKTDQASARALETAISDAPADLRFHAYAGLVFTQKGELRAKNPFTKAMGEASPTLIDLFNLVDLPQGREALRLDALNDAIKARRLYERSAALLQVADAAFADFAMRK
ncbi:MAG: UvrD-helicase domain-containing protein, partial [Pseudomonadota bacterium]